MTGSPPIRVPGGRGSRSAWGGTRRLLAWLLVAGSGAVAAAPPDDLRARFEAVRAQPALRLSDRPVYLQSTEASDKLEGEVYALIEQPFGAVRQALAPAGAWCGVLILHLNVKYCRAASRAGGDALAVGLGRKSDQPLVAVDWLRFDYRVASSAEDHLQVELQAPEGPLGTHHYRLVLEAVPHAEGRTLLHLRYAYRFGLAARLATQTYLATLGRDKVGFTVVGQSADGQPRRVGGLRGVLERNTLRYHLAVEAYLGARALPPDQQLRRRLEDWFAATERYAQQLHEIDRDTYIAMKLREVRRQETGPAPPGLK